MDLPFNDTVMNGGTFMNSEHIWILVVLGLLVILAVIAYNMYQENQYRKQIREQFGHSDKDALLESKTQSVRDGKVQGKQGKPLKLHRTADVSQVEPPVATEDAMQEVDFVNKSHVSTERIVENDLPPLSEEQENTATVLSSQSEEPSAKYSFTEQALPQYEQTQLAGKKPTLLDLNDMTKQQLIWFSPCFDYMAYIALREPQELHSLPRFLGGKPRVQIAACTMDNRWQIAEPIPGVYYQGFIVGLQAISRTGLITAQELETFGSQLNEFAEKLDAALAVTDIDEFLKTARPLDEVCERVDQIVAIHLVARNTKGVSGINLQKALEAAGFELSKDGAFYLYNEQGNPLFSIINIDRSAFTTPLLNSKSYRGFSVLLDVPHVPNGKASFERFMHIVIGLASELGLDLVNDKLEELSTEWLREAGTYVVERQEEMKAIGVEAGSDLAKRLFS